MGWLRTLFGTGKGIGPREADGLMRSGALLLDVREPAEWRAGHAPGARHIRLRAYAGRGYVTHVESVGRGGGATRSGGL
jgi:adenylosuccinate synthase